MFGIGFPELIVILIVALLVVGPTKLPGVARSVGRALGEFRRMADDVKDSLQQEIDREEEAPGGSVGQGAAGQVPADPPESGGNAAGRGPGVPEPGREADDPYREQSDRLEAQQKDPEPDTQKGA